MVDTVFGVNVLKVAESIVGAELVTVTVDEVLVVVFPWKSIAIAVQEIESFTDASLEFTIQVVPVDTCRAFTSQI